MTSSDKASPRHPTCKKDDQSKAHEGSAQRRCSPNSSKNTYDHTPPRWLHTKIQAESTRALVQACLPADSQDACSGCVQQCVIRTARARACHIEISFIVTRNGVFGQGKATYTLHARNMTRAKPARAQRKDPARQTRREPTGLFAPAWAANQNSVRAFAQACLPADSQHSKRKSVLRAKR